MSWKPEVRTGTDPKFYGNNLAFATKEEAEYSAKDLMNRWLLVNELRVVESDQTVNYRLDLTTGELIAVSEEVPA
jgi:hypothetical protein